MTFFRASILVLVSLALSHSQRPPYAGSRPIGYPELGAQYQDPDARPEYGNVFDGSNVNLADRFGPDATTQKLPVDALGDQYLVDMISRWPLDKQPFWFINSQQIEAHRNRTNAVEGQAIPTPPTNSPRVPQGNSQAQQVIPQIQQNAPQNTPTPQIVSPQKSSSPETAPKNPQNLPDDTSSRSSRKD